MLKSRGQTGLEAKHLASVLASRHSGLGLKVLALVSNQNLTPFYFLAHSDHAVCRRSLQVISRLGDDVVLFVVL